MPLQGGSFLFTTKFPDTPGRYSFYWPRKDERLSQPWSHPVVLNMGPPDCKSSTLTARPSGWVSCGPSLLLLFKMEDLLEHFHIYKCLIICIAQNFPCYLHFAFCLIVWCSLLNCNLTQICMILWNISNGKMDDILPLELLQGIMRHIERKKRGPSYWWRDINWRKA